MTNWLGPLGRVFARRDFNVMLHELRGDLLREMPRPVGTMLSAGCAGGWYFDWIAEKYGPVAHHIGLEYYTPRPDTLPANVEWIANTCANMAGVASASCDLVFSGQNIEHLWPDEVTGFLTEAARVTRPGGWLVVDSPNRLLTTALNWNHPEHTVELSVAEMTELLNLAGFTVAKRAGLWLCRDPRDGRVLPIQPKRRWDWPPSRRIAEAKDRPDESFLWWIEAQRTDAAPDAAAVGTRMEEIFAAVWPERVQRLRGERGLKKRRQTDGEWIVAPAGREGRAMAGPNAPLRPGAYRAEFTLAPEPGSGDYACFDVVAGRDGSQVLATGVVNDMERRKVLSFTLDRTTFGIQFRCHSLGKRGFAVRRGIGLSS